MAIIDRPIRITAKRSHNSFHKMRAHDDSVSSFRVFICTKEATEDIVEASGKMVVLDRLLRYGESLLGGGAR